MMGNTPPEKQNDHMSMVSQSVDFPRNPSMDTNGMAFNQDEENKQSMIEIPEAEKFT